MKVHTTNYCNTLIEVADDSPAICGTTPPTKGESPTVANIHFDLVSKHPYQYSSDDVAFRTFAVKKDLIESEMETARAAFFAKGQACMRCSPLTKRYGWGVHSNAEGKIALFGVESEEYERLLNDPAVDKVKAMRSSRK